MNLIQQFPDISQKIRSKIAEGQRNYKTANAKQAMPYSEEEAVSAYYEGEFRRRHFKLFFIVGSILGIIYFALLKGSWILNWITA
jgi:hypothetical protein